VRLERDEKFTGRSIDDPSETELDHFKEWDILIKPEFNLDEADMKNTASQVAAHAA
jgi:hypothetical protein